MNVPIEKRFRILCEITRAQHFAWREAALSMSPDLDPLELTNTMWELVGIQTAEAYMKHLDPLQPLALQIAQSIAWSSECMGETVRVEEEEGGSVFLIHDDCPWYHWHKRLGILEEDRPGCDVWFQTVVLTVNNALGATLRVETECTLPEGCECCRRRFWDQ